MRALMAAVMLLAATPVFAEGPTAADALLKEANTALAAKDWRTMATALDAAQELLPFSLSITRYRILAYAELGETEAALAIAGKIADRGLSVTLGGHEGFEALTAQKAFRPISKKMAANLSPAGRAETVLKVDRDDLLPEAVAHIGTGLRQYWYVGTVRDGAVYVGKTMHARATGGVYGVRIIDDLIWTIENTTPPYAASAEKGDVSGFFAYDLATGEPRCAAPLKFGGAILGAIETTPIGLIASDSQTPRLIALDGCEGEPRIIAEDPRFANLQGIAYDPERRRLYVADYLTGIYAVDLEGGAATLVANTADAHLGGIDGLAYYNGDLIGVQNGTEPQRIVRLRLNPAGDAVDRLDVLQRALPEWSEPTNGIIVDKQFVYSATSNWPAYSKGGNEVAGVLRKPLRLMSAPLE